MNYQQGNLRLYFHFAAAILILSGCAPQMQKPMRICPGAESAVEALSLLRSRLENTVPLKANGQCRLQYYAEGKPHKENFPVKLWVNPPTQIYIQGDVAFDPEGIVVGSNEEEFWLSIKLKEVSSYWWGRWSEGDFSEKLMISPKLVLEALGIAEFGGGESWSLSNEGAFDVLTKRDSRGVVIKKVYIFNCDHLVSKIEYFGADGQVAAIMELGKYEEVSEWFSAPAVIKIVSHTAESAGDLVSITISLKSIRPVEFTDKQRRHLFTRPEPRGFRHIYKIVGGNIIKDSRNK